MEEKAKMACKKCDSTELIRLGIRITAHGKKQRWQCKSCGAIMIGDLLETKPVEIATPKPAEYVSPASIKAKLIKEA